MMSLQVLKFFLFALAAAKEPAVGLHQFTRQDEGIDGSDAVADEVGNEFALAFCFLRHPETTPQGADLLGIVAELST